MHRTGLSAARIACAFSRSVLRIEGVFPRMSMPSEAERISFGTVDRAERGLGEPYNALHVAHANVCSFGFSPMA